MDDFERALKTFKINKDARRKQLEEFLNLAERFCNDSEFLEQLRVSTISVSDRFELIKREGL